jgi:hypothetical protein
MHPFLIKLPKADIKNIDLSDSNDIRVTNIVPYQLCSLGYHCFIKRTRDAINITKNLQTKTQFYYVVNPFENNISNYEDDINNATKTYLKIKEDYSMDFQKIWETVFIFDLASMDVITGCVLTEKENENVIVNVIEQFRQKTGKENTKDNFVSTNKEIDLLKKNSCNLIIGHLKSETPDIVHNYNYLEQENYKNILEEIIHILKYQKEKGNAIVQIYDIYTITTIKMIYMLAAFFDEVFIYKPFMSRQSETDKYLILKGFNENKNKENIIKMLEKFIKKLGNDKYINDLLFDFVVPKDFYNIFKFINIRLVNNQQIMINDIVVYIKENNYFGDKFHDYRNKQIDSSKWWITNFYPPTKNLFDKNKEDLLKIYKSAQEKLNLESQKFLENMM